MAASSEVKEPIDRRNLRGRELLESFILEEEETPNTKSEPSLDTYAVSSDEDAELANRKDISVLHPDSDNEDLRSQLLQALMKMRASKEELVLVNKIFYEKKGMKNSERMSTGSLVAAEWGKNKMQDQCGNHGNNTIWVHQGDKSEEIVNEGNNIDGKVVEKEQECSDIGVNQNAKTYSKWSSLFNSSHRFRLSFCVTNISNDSVLKLPMGTS